MRIVITTALCALVGLSACSIGFESDDLAKGQNGTTRAFETRGDLMDTIQSPDLCGGDVASVDVAAQPAGFVVELAEGDALVAWTSGPRDVDTVLGLFGPYGSVPLIVNDDGGSGLLSRLEWTARISGEHVLVVFGFDGGVRGRVGVQIETGGLPGCLPSLSCVSDMDCDGKRRCVEGVCSEAVECTEDDQCAEGWRCYDGRCDHVSECRLDADCGPEQRCLEGFCSLVPECASDADCGVGGVCVAGQCSPGAGCGSDVECGPSQVCTAGQCVDIVAECTQDAQCDGGVCDNTICVSLDGECGLDSDFDGVGDECDPCPLIHHESPELQAESCKCNDGCTLSQVVLFDLSLADGDQHFGAEIDAVSIVRDGEVHFAVPRAVVRGGEDVDPLALSRAATLDGACDTESASEGAVALGGRAGQGSLLLDLPSALGASLRNGDVVRVYEVGKTLCPGSGLRDDVVRVAARDAVGSRVVALGDIGPGVWEIVVSGLP